LGDDLVSSAVPDDPKCIHKTTSKHTLLDEATVTQAEKKRKTEEQKELTNKMKAWMEESLGVTKA
ncbi:hypothetical protein FRC06_000906, partial [Ceratobasidium sp. 370]